MSKNNEHQLLHQIDQFKLQQKQLQLQLSENHHRLQVILRRVWQLNDQTQKRIANDLHDGVGQLLTALVNELSQDELNADRQKQVLELAKSALSDIRHISRLLRPPILYDLGLPAALSGLVRQINHSSNNLAVSLAVADDIVLNEEIQILVFRICQEALTNVVKHAEATEVTVNLTQNSQGLNLTIKDNGKGFELTEMTKKGVGILSMQDRTASFGGWALIESEPGNGCVVSITIPRQSLDEELI